MSCYDDGYVYLSLALQLKCKHQTEINRFGMLKCADLFTDFIIQIIQIIRALIQTSCYIKPTPLKICFYLFLYER